jgi:hypothetical protein
VRCLYVFDVVLLRGGDFSMYLVCCGMYLVWYYCGEEILVCIWCVVVCICGMLLVCIWCGIIEGRRF